MVGGSGPADSAGNEAIPPWRYAVPGCDLIAMTPSLLCFLPDYRIGQWRDQAIRCSSLLAQLLPQRRSVEVADHRMRTGGTQARLIQAAQHAEGPDAGAAGGFHA